MAMYATSTQRRIDHRGAAKAGLAIAIFVSGLGLGATIATTAGIVSHEGSVNAPALDPHGSSLQQHSKDETSLGASNGAAGTSFDVAHHVGQSVPQSLQSGAAINAVRYQRRAEFGVGGP
jgi:cysteine synthase